MPAERLSMRKVREVLRLKYACGASERVVGHNRTRSRHTRNDTDDPERTFGQAACCEHWRHNFLAVTGPFAATQGSGRRR
jgi:hypothetical protein